MKLIPDSLARPVWRAMLVCLALVLGGVAASQSGWVVAAATVWSAALVTALRYAWFGLRRRRVAMVAIALGVLVLGLTKGHTGGAIAAGIILGSVLLAGQATNRHLTDRSRTILFGLVWIPLVLALAVPGNVEPGRLRNVATMARVVLIVFLAATPIDLVAHMRLHFLRLRPKLAICAVFIGVVPLVILVVIGLLLMWGTLGGSRANRSADLLDSWKQEWAAGGQLEGLPVAERFTATAADTTGPAPAWLPGYRTALRDTSAITEFVEAAGDLWLVRVPTVATGRVEGLRLDNASFTYLAKILRADISVVGVTRPDSAGASGVSISIGGERTHPGEQGLKGEYHERPADAGFWRRPLYFGGSLLSTAVLEGNTREEGQVLLTVKTSLADLRDEFLSGRNKVNTAMVVVLGLVAVTLLTVEIFALIFGLRIASGITGAVKELHRGTQRLAAGDLDTSIEIPNQDEFGDLAASFNEMTTAVKQGREHALARQRLQQEMETARQIQARLLPTSEPLLAGYEVTGRSVPSRQVGGDYFDFVAQGGGHLGIAIGDVSGKGVPAALLMANLQASLQGQVIHPASVAEVMARVNNLMVQSTDAHMFASFFYGVLDPDAGRFTCANAGHNPPLLIRADGTAAWLEEGGLLLGMMPDLEYPQSEITFGRGDVLVLYTDGITEAEAPHPAAGDEPGEMFGEERLERVVRDVRERTAAQIRDAIQGAVERHLAGDPAGDDITLVVIKRTLGEKIESV